MIKSATFAESKQFTIT